MAALTQYRVLSHLAGGSAHCKGLAACLLPAKSHRRTLAPDAALNGFRFVFDRQLDGVAVEPVRGLSDTPRHFLGKPNLPVTT